MSFARRNFLTAFTALAAPATSARLLSTPSASLRGRLAAAFQKTILFDSHEHFWEESQRVSKPLDLFSLASDYVIGDLTSAGLSRDAAQAIQDGKAADLERWRAFEPYWKYARFTGYCRALRLAVRDLYGVEEISLKTLPKINHAIVASNRPGIYRHLVRDRAGIRAYVQDDYWNAVPVRSTDDLHLMARRFDRFIVPSGPADIRKLEELTDVSITSLPTLQHSLRKSFLHNLDAGMVAVKVGLAYMRELHFREVEPADAARDLRPAHEIRREAARRFPQQLRPAFPELGRLHVPPDDATGGYLQCSCSNPHRDPSRKPRRGHQQPSDPAHQHFPPLPANFVRPVPHQLPLRERAFGSGEVVSQCLRGFLLGARDLSGSGSTNHG
jgi:hypothetical protein